jgi:hypothetical protein
MARTRAARARYYVNEGSDSDVFLDSYSKRIDQPLLSAHPMFGGCIDVALKLVNAKDPAQKTRIGKAFARLHLSLDTKTHDWF